MERFVTKSFTPADRDWVVQSHAEQYAQAERFDATFGVLVADIVDAFTETQDPTCEAGWIAWDGAQRVGSIFCVRLTEKCAKLRLFLLLPQARGTGLASEMLSTSTKFACAAGYEEMRLWTHESHRAAGALYARTGWRLMSSEPVVAFGQPNVEQHWEIVL